MPRAIPFVPKNERLTAFCDYESQKRGKILYPPTIGRRGTRRFVEILGVLLALDLIATLRATWDTSLHARSWWPHTHWPNPTTHMKHIFRARA